MVQDFLSLLTVKSEETLKGTYYARRPLSPEDAGVSFAYDILNEPRSSYANILGTLNTVTSTQTIKTNDLCGFKVKGYCATQDGGFWQIEEIEKRIVSKKSKQALRITKNTIETEYVLRMIEVDNPWGLK